MKTDIGLAAGMSPEILEAVAKDLPMLESSDVSNAVLYVLGTKPHVQVIKRQNYLVTPLSLNYDCFRCMSLSSNRWVKQFKKKICRENSIERGETHNFE